MQFPLVIERGAIGNGLPQQVKGAHDLIFRGGKKKQ